MKKIILILLILGLTTSMSAQKMGRQRIQALKTSYITTSINLTTTEAEKFWPVYNLYTEKIQDLKSKIESESFRKAQETNSINSITDEKAEEILANRIKYEEEILRNKVILIKELKKIISAKKILKLQKSERDFNRRLLQEYGKRRGINRQ
ncbi:sensor of ECF-type sigma factor [Lutibacter sp. TH_r2]|uniref:sensor of ECF-type sigma factor n=1 Tax=Lutibacter sp. TH_r2 TaxID=3082083 RepID=UPI002955BB75|nr:sensor of ECF-type sigma factor [Lutibacter sp. TH_r2]MDV7188051.1 sensor of ECF-type sigma factor [Lutibacter sp. TH_r2]